MLDGNSSFLRFERRDVVLVLEAFGTCLDGARLGRTKQMYSTHISGIAEIGQSSLEHCRECWRSESKTRVGMDGVCYSIFSKGLGDDRLGGFHWRSWHAGLGLDLLHRRHGV